MDIVERLRNCEEASRLALFKFNFAILLEAADEIERLQEALKEIACDCDHCCNENGLGCDNWIARSALQKKGRE